MRNLPRFLACGNILFAVDLDYHNKRDKNRNLKISSSTKAHSAQEDFVNQEGQWATTVNSQICPLGASLFPGFCM